MKNKVILQVFGVEIYDCDNDHIKNKKLIQQARLLVKFHCEKKEHFTICV